MQVKSKVQSQKGLGSVIDRFKTGVEWRPGNLSSNLRQGRKHEVTQPEEYIRLKVGETLLNYFKCERPPADNYVILPGSLRLVDSAHDVWMASVQSMVHTAMIEPRHHISRVRFRVLRVIQFGETTFTIHHNHVIFI
jgi:hypothetical protein